jgi:hypothetical protein
MRRVVATVCPQCGDELIAPGWSQHVSERCIRNGWCCDGCGRRFDELVCLCAPRLDGSLADPDGAAARPYFVWRAT